MGPNVPTGNAGIPDASRLRSVAAVSQLRYSCEETRYVSTSDKPCGPGLAGQQVVLRVHAAPALPVLLTAEPREGGLEDT